MERGKMHDAIGALHAEREACRESYTGCIKQWKAGRTGHDVISASK